MLACGRVDDLEAGQEPQLHGLLRQRESARDDGLACDDGRHGGEDHQRRLEHVRRHHEERIFRGFGMRQHHGALAEIVQCEARQDQPGPRHGNRFAPEVAHIGIERLGACHREEHRAKDDEAQHLMRQQEHHGVVRAERVEDCKTVLHDVIDAKRAERDEPYETDGPEKTTDNRGAFFLNQEETDQQRQGDRKDEGFDATFQFGNDCKAFDCRENRYGRGQECIAEKHAGAADRDQEEEGRAPSDRALDQGHERERAAFSAVVEPGQHQHVFHRDHDDQRPDHQRDDAEYIFAE